MDELTLAFLRRQLRLRGRLAAMMTAGSFTLGWMTPREELANVAALLLLLAAWWVMGWAVHDRAGGPIAAVLSSSHARRPWLVAYLVAAALMAGGIGFACLLPNGFRPALVAGIMGLVYGWILAALGLSLLIRLECPRDTHWACGLLLAVVVATPSPVGEALKRSAWAWHPLSLFKSGIAHALSASGVAGNSPAAGGVWALPMYGVIVPLLLSLIAWRWMLRSLDRLEAAPINH